MMKNISLGSKILFILVGAFFLLMSFDVFAMTQFTFLERIGGFLINASPGIAVIIVTIIFWKKEKILSLIIFGIALFWGIFLLIEGNFPEMIGGLLIIDIPLLLAGIILLISSKKRKE